METKNFLSRLFCLISLVGFLTSCQSLQRRKSTKPQEPSTVEVVEETQTPQDQPNVTTPQFLEKQSPKLGIILGPGGALSYSQIGFLQELEKQKIPVHSIAGIEWGALIAASYAGKAKAHAIEWKLLKLPLKKFINKGFLSGNSAPKVSDFESYLSSIFEDLSFRDLEIGFNCPYISVRNEKFRLYTKGRIKNAVQVCWPSAPHFTVQNVGADYAGIKRAAEHLRSMGAEIVVYVDVLSRNQALTAKDRKQNTLAALNIVQSKSIVELIQQPLINDVIQIPLPGQKINSYKELRSIIRMGQLKSKSSIQELARKYAY